MFTICWISLAIVGVAIFLFGAVVAVVPVDDTPLLRSIGVASIGMGLFGYLITVMAYRHRKRWAWLALWYYPIFWVAHLLGDLPPGQDRVHQIVFLALSLAGLLLPAREFFSSKSGDSVL